MSLHGLPRHPSLLGKNWCRATALTRALSRAVASPLPLTAVYLSNTLQTLHPNASSFLVTQDQSFLLGSFAAEPSNGLKLREVEGSAKLSARVYVPAGRRRDGPGAMGERVTWGEYDVSWAGKSWKVIVAEVSSKMSPPLTSSLTHFGQLCSGPKASATSVNPT